MRPIKIKFFSPLFTIPYFISPIVLIVSCSQPLSPAQILAQNLSQPNVVQFAPNEGVYDDQAIAKFIQVPPTLTTKLVFNLTNIDFNRFEIKVIKAHFIKNGQNLSHSNVKIVIEVKNKTLINNQLDVSLTNEIVLKYQHIETINL